jgi:hypothetical protein
MAAQYAFSREVNPSVETIYIGTLARQSIRTSLILQDVATIEHCFDPVTIKTNPEARTHYFAAIGEFRR